MKIKITNGMLLAVVINVIYAKAIGVTQGIVARQAGGDMWLVTLLSTMISIVVILLVVFIIKRSPKENIFQQPAP
ncbi:MAG: GerAB/ArcD/ProY family transporter [Bacillus sp. (in: Bacteria)]|nr:GerAB/ArcD/ProY family transporter [Bacillus sp. (in: firmicutes)]